MPIAIFYVSGHGYGHAVRMAEVVRGLAATESGWSVIVRTTAPPHLFAGIDGIPVRVEAVSIDPGIVEDGTLEIDIAATIGRLEPFFRHRHALVAAEAEYLRHTGADVIVADIPYLAGDIGAEAGVPVLGISNFTWDFIYEPFLAGHSWGSAMLMAMKDGYDKMSVLARLPFHHEMRFAPRVIDVGLVAPRSHRTKEDVRSCLGVLPSDTRTRVYVGFRGAVPIGALHRAAEESSDCLFFYVGDVGTASLENLRPVVIGPRLTFADLLSGCDTAISKLGYGMLAACVASGTSLLFPPRIGFREDLALQEGAQRYLRSHEVSAGDFQSGNWRPYLRLLQELPLPMETLLINGAEECGRLIVATAK